MISDDAHLPELTRRQEEILSLIVRAYTQHPEPVSSKYLVETFGLNYSSATVRNEMVLLEELGYIVQPHTSAGRIPSQNGYRYFVKRLLNTSDISSSEQSRITERLQSTPLATEQWMRLAATILSRTTQAAALVTPPSAETNRFKHLELISIQGRLVLMVLVLQEGTVYQQMITLTDPIPQTRLGDTAQVINGLCMDASAAQVRARSVQLGLLEREITELVADMLDRADANQLRLIYREGLGDLISTFPNNEGAQQAVRVLEERAVLNMVLSEVLTPTVNTVQVVIAGNGRWEQLSHLTMVISRYGIHGQASGAVGVLGPTHINYGRAISAVGYISGVMTDQIEQAYEQLPSGKKAASDASEDDKDD